MRKITVYTTPTCVYCRMAKEFFARNNVAYEEKNVVLDETAREEMIKKSGQMGVPVVEVDGKIIVGFDETMLKDAIGL